MYSQIKFQKVHEIVNEYPWSESKLLGVPVLAAQLETAEVVVVVVVSAEVVAVAAAAAVPAGHWTDGSKIQIHVIQSLHH